MLTILVASKSIQSANVICVPTGYRLMWRAC
jgi:hypothetical protein